MEAGVIPGRKPWNAEQGQRRNPLSGAVYSGANPIVLELAMSLRGTDSPLWCGYGQAKSRGWHPRKGSKAALILRPEVHTREEVDESGEKTEFVWTSYMAANVFNRSDLEGDGLTAFIDGALGGVTLWPEPERLEAAEAVPIGWPVLPKFGGSKAFYAPGFVVRWSDDDHHTTHQS